jgi:hypothetical protein
LTLYEKAIVLSKPYLGPATESFIDRQCKTRLKIEPPQLMTSQLAELSKWVGVGAGLIMDQTKANELSAKLAALR